MSKFTPIDLSKLPAPSVIQAPSFAQLFEQMKTKAIEELPEIAPYMDLQSEPMVKLMEVAAYHRMLDRAEFNDGARACMLPVAAGADLDNLAANWGVSRLVIQETNNTIEPAIPEVLESDDALRQRVQLSIEAHTTAGSRGAYLFHALSAHGNVKDASVTSPAPGQVRVVILSHEGDGAPSAELVARVEEALNDEDVRPLTDHVLVLPATILLYHVEAHLTLHSGPDQDIVLDLVNTALTAYLEAQRGLGRDVTRSGLFATLHQVGVQNVALVSPAADIEVGEDQAAYCPHRGAGHHRP